MGELFSRYGITVSRADVAQVRHHLEAAASLASKPDERALQTIYALAHHRLTMSQLDTAYSYLTLLAFWAPTNSDYLRALGRVQQLLGDPQGALAILTMALSLGDDSPELGLCIAECHFACQQRELALRVLLEAELACGADAQHAAVCQRIRALAQLARDSISV
ncbi:hypothetical protein PIN31115_04518 [Pandoraea iniqua]|uniref:CesD/SycD/LcrH family type III secretion system chaperone n=1 Tax=Pandoraea iniqua TaxID=2508288 RepID=A0A5E4YJB0_9BURK|nr:hypothetical protein [Pandoraea iniqua]VVE48378.1 hypothetical protein PIN31115_04518 [Pandoraea iniqua]